MSASDWVRVGYGYSGCTIYQNKNTGSYYWNASMDRTWAPCLYTGPVYDRESEFVQDDDGVWRWQHGERIDNREESKE